MSKTKSISDLVTELQQENERAKSIVKAFDSAVQHEFGYNTKELHRLIEKQELYERRKAERQVQ